jgi:hypothetical protein
MYSPPIYDARTYGDGLPPAPEARSQRHTARNVVVILLVLAIIGMGGYWQFGRNKSDSASYPAHWDPRVAGLAAFVEHTRGLKFEHPVNVIFMTDAAFKQRVTTGPESLSKKDRAKLQNDVGYLRALGLVSGHLDLLAAVNQTSSEGVNAFYDPADKVIRIRGTKLDVATRVTVVHEMTHALQDQHFSLVKLQKMNNDDESGSIQALVEGDATYVENAYVDKLSAADKAAYDAQSAAQDAQANFKGVPPVLQIMFGAPYQFGPALVEVLRTKGGQASLDTAFRHPPTSEEQVFDPVKFINYDKPETVTKPSAPAGAKVFDGGTFDPIGWYTMLSERVDAHVALRAVDGWGGDQYIAYQTSDNRSCQRTRYQGETSTDTATMQRALAAWMQALPVKTASVTRDGSTLLFESCDPGESVKIATGQSLQAIALPASRAALLQSILHDGGVSLDTAHCIADRVVETSTVAQLNDPSGAAFSSPEGQDRVRGITIACKAQNR